MTGPPPADRESEQVAPNPPQVGVPFFVQSGQGYLELETLAPTREPSVGLSDSVAV